jgi:hypothetical protein
VPAPAPAEAPVAPAPPRFEGDVALNPVSEEPPDGTFKRKALFAAGLGYTSGGTIKHPELTGNGFSGEMLELAGGVELDPKWRVLVAFTSFQTKLERAGAANVFRSASGAFYGGAGYRPLAGCNNCSDPGGLGGEVIQQPLHVHTLGPRVDYLPFGNDSLYLGVTAGAAMMQDVSFRGGFAIAARAGFEWRPYSALGLSIEAGAHGQVYSDSSAALPYAAVMLRLLAPTSSFGTSIPVTKEPAPPPAPAQPPSQPPPPQAPLPPPYN